MMLCDLYRAWRQGRTCWEQQTASTGFGMDMGFSPLALLVLVNSGKYRRRRQHTPFTCSNRRSGHQRRRGSRHTSSILFDGDAHMPAKSPLPSVAFVFTNALVRGNSSVPASTARSLPVTTLLALAAALTTRLGGEVRLLILAWRHRVCEVGHN